MDEKAELIQKLREARDKMLAAINAFPKDKRGTILFDQWSLKDVIAHLSGWDQLTIDKIKEFLNGIEPDWVSLNEFNRNNVEKRKNWSWDKVYQEFVDLSLRNIKSYEDIPIQKFVALIWKNKKFTPKKFVKIDIRHFLKEHLPEILKYS